MKENIYVAKDKAIEITQEIISWTVALAVVGLAAYLYKRGYNLGYPNLTSQEWMALGYALASVMTLLSVVRYTVKLHRNK